MACGLFCAVLCLFFLTDPPQSGSVLCLPVRRSVRKKSTKVGRTGKEGRRAQLLRGGSLNSVRSCGTVPEECWVPVVCLARPWLGQAWTSPERSPFPSGRDQYAVSGGLGGRVTMCYVDNVLAARDTASEPFGNSLFSLVTGAACLLGPRGSGAARTQEDPVPS